MLVVTWIVVLMIPPCRPLIVKGLQVGTDKRHYVNFDIIVEAWGGMGGMPFKAPMKFNFVSPRCAYQTKRCLCDC